MSTKNKLTHISNLVEGILKRINSDPRYFQERANYVSRILELEEMNKTQKRMLQNGIAPSKSESSVRIENEMLRDNIKRSVDECEKLKATNLELKKQINTTSKRQVKELTEHSIWLVQERDRLIGECNKFKAKLFDKEQPEPKKLTVGELPDKAKFNLFASDIGAKENPWFKCESKKTSRMIDTVSLSTGKQVKMEREITVESILDDRQGYYMCICPNCVNIVK